MDQLVMFANLCLLGVFVGAIIVVYERMTNGLTKDVKRGVFIAGGSFAIFLVTQLLIALL